MKSFFESKTSEYDWLISSFFGCHVSFRGCKCRLQLERQQGSYIWVFFPRNWKGRDEKIDIMMRWKWSYLLKYVLKVLYRSSMVASNSNIISLSMTLNAPNETCSKPEPLSWWTTITNEWKDHQQPTMDIKCCKALWMGWLFAAPTCDQGCSDHGKRNTTTMICHKVIA